MEVRRMSASELDRLAGDIVSGKTFFTANGIEMGEAFGLILSVSVPTWPDDYIETLGGAWAPWSTSARSAAIFTEMHPIHENDVPRLLARIARGNGQLPLPKGGGLSSPADPGRP